MGLTALIAGALLVQSAVPTPVPAPLHEGVDLTRTPSGHFAVDVRIETQGPWPFLVDTGASHTAIAEPLAVQFGHVPVIRRDDVQTLTTRYSAERFRLYDIEFGPRRLESLNTVVAPIESDATLSAFGLLGADAFDLPVMTIDLAAARLDFTAPAPAHHDASIDSDTRLIFATARVGRFETPVHVLVDTGATQTLVNPALARRLSGFDPVLRLRVSDMNDLGRTEDTRMVRLETVRVGGLCPRRLTGIEADLDIFRALGWTREPAIVLGLDALEGAVITIAREAGVVELSQAPGAQACRNDRVQRRTAREALPG